MPLKNRLPLLFFFTVFILVFSVNAAHGLSPAHRRSLAFKKKPHRQLDIPGLLTDLGGAPGASTPGPSSTSATPSDATSPPTTNPSTLPTNTDPPSTSPSATTTSPSSDTSPTSSPPSTSIPPSSSPASCPLGVDLLGNCLLPTTTSPGSSSSSPSSTTDTPTSTPSTTGPGSSSPPPASSTPPSSNCPLGLDLLGNCILPTTSPGSSSPSPSPTTDTSTPSTTSPGSSSPPPASSTPPSSNCPLGLDLLGNCILPTTSPGSSSPSPSPTTDTSTPSTTSPESSSSTPPSDSCALGLDLLGNCILPTSSPAVSGTPDLPLTTLITPPSDSPSETPSPTPDCPLGVVNGLCVLPPFSTPNPGSSSSPTPTPTSPPADPCGPLGVELGLCPSNSSPPVSAPPLTLTYQTSPSTTSQSQSPSQSPDQCDPFGIALGLCPTLGSPSSSPSQSAFLSGTVPSSGSFSLLPGTQSQPSLSIGQSSGLTTSVPSGTVSSSTSGSGNGISSSSLPVIAFPSGTNTVSSTTSLSSLTTSDTSFPSFTPPPQAQLSYITQTSLLGASVPSSLPVTLSDPDAVATTLSFATPSNSAPTTTPILLPSNLPARIYPPTQVDPNSLSGFSLVSILFDQFLPWAFVAQSTQSQGQLFLWLPTILQSALGLSPQQVKTFALQVYVPAAYSGPADVDLLMTTFLLYIPSDQVSVLANQIKVVSSPFYTSLGDPYRSLALHVDPAFPVNSVQDPNAVPGTTSSTTSSGNKSRTDAIIGVASALGGLALVVLGVLIFRSVKRSRDLRHHRLSDPNAPPNAPYPDRTGRDFDQDSIGGQRRRSFYFAEDSLRGQQAVQQTAVPVAQSQGQHVMQQVSQVEYSYHTSPDGVRERRGPVVTGAISAPILTQSSLNW